MSSTEQQKPKPEMKSGSGSSGPSPIEEWEQPLLNAVEVLWGLEAEEGEFDCNAYHVSEEMQKAAETAHEVIPKLLDSYKGLWELATSMMAAWEKLQEEQQKTIRPATAFDLQKYTHYDEKPNF